ncbi:MULTISPECIES: DUF1127 domain-containing protein [unclassified Bradyrhizobium]|uniref:DUF1127 domain-containing protein n=1 Tax=unclassified Bradyrhizobium TaxID=2631580 RepID=UPI00247893B7|nr:MULTISPECIES: DUF1127 domain-containing protein [unclassified Bradyrhizobium]WGR68435.1 DUF1127 domain-containing protein [Bradyrhizobium sp. ISRA426]WGR80490.1 DUF1127 domain-containing protein [Bradyrhizobium sp. ISRA430]WGR83675.1 DUF1127 domain-containing protein [Bradyrhizobium sp. ISRA432]
MSAIYSAARMRRTAASPQQAISLFQRLRSAWQERRRRRGVQADLSALSDRELMDIGTTRGEIDYIASQRSIARPHRSSAQRIGDALVILLLFNVFSLISADRARAQCTAQDVLRNHLAVKAAPAAPGSQIPISSAADVSVWKTILIGTFADSFALRRAMDAIGCGVGNSADEILARPAFSLSDKKAEVQLVAVSVAELGFQGETASLRDIYARAQGLGFGLAAAEIAPQLRLQYLDQPIGEFLTIGMEPIRTWAGEPVLLTVANGGAGLILIGQDGHDDAQISVISRFVFVRPDKPASAEAAAMAR